MAPLALRFMWARALPVLLVLALGTASAAAPPKPPAPPPISCEAVVSLGTAWVSTQGNTSYTTLNLNIINKAAAILAVPWTLTLKSAGYGNIRQVQAVPLLKSCNCWTRCNFLASWSLFLPMDGLLRAHEHQ